jgi:hypothetical protein
MSNLTTLELALLRLIHKEDGKANWYQLETGLSRLDVPRTPDMTTVLNELITRGLVVRRVVTGSPFDKWSLTDKGLAALEATGVERIEVSA